MEEKIALLTDSTCDIPGEMLRNLAIEFLPLKIIYKNGHFLDRVNITPKKIYEKFSEEIPTTSMPTPAEIEEKFIELKERGFTHIIAIHISGGLSSTFNISKMVSEKIKDINIEVIDSRLLSMALGRLVLYARELIVLGDLDFNNIVNKIKDKINDIELYFIVETLKYLKKGGRIGKVKGTIGELLNIKPIISIDEDGQYYNIDKVRSRSSSINKLYTLAKDKIIQGKCYVDVMHADAENEAQDLIDKFKKLKNVKDTFLGEISPAMVVHAGPGLIGVCVSSV